ncbi:MAG: FAD-dependent oxidoreductase [Bryobacterales bacterium]|nr:FAD-dependent oxidoreductase [Bryobacterales bacterium]
MRTLTGVLLLAMAGSAWAQSRTYDFVVYGGSAGGVMTAVGAARQGLKVALVHPGRHIGGLVSGGLSGTDLGRREVIGGLALEFYFRAGRHYRLDRHAQELAWTPEPKVAEAIMREMLRESQVTLIEQQRLREKTGVRREGARLVEIVMENGARYQARMFADCSYEGDLMAQAKVSYTYGRESAQQYGESLAGIRAHTPSHQFAVDVPARDERGRLLPEISAEPRGEAGAADKRIQAYNFRVIATDVPENRVPWPKPDNYDVARYELLARYITAMTPYLGRPLDINEVNLLRLIPNGKADFNNRNGFSTDYIGKNYEYPEGSYAVRDRIWKEHEDYQKGFYYFLATDPRVPKPLQEQMNRWGLAKDEFVDTGNWPHQLYIREARRMVGEYVAVQKDLQTDLSKPDAVGMGSYNSDSHNLQRFVNDKGFVENEGDVQVPVKPYQIAYRSLVPKRGEVENLLVPVCLSASHIAYSSMRMEPQYMLLGHAAGVAAALAIRGGKAVQDVPVAELQRQLLAEGGVLELGTEYQNRALSVIRARFAGPPRKGPVPWGRPEPKP